MAHRDGARTVQHCYYLRAAREETDVDHTFEVSEQKEKKKKNKEKKKKKKQEKRD